MEGESMKVYLVQHAEARKREEDPTRALSEEGWRDLERVSNTLRVKDIEVAAILHSGKLRAEQTAEKLSEVVGSSGGVGETDGLAPLDDPNIWSGRLEAELNDVMLVGHLPQLSRLAGLLLAGDPNRKVISFRNGGVTCLERNEEGNWSVEWIVTP
jgi:phosphohistidine phosphatase